MSVPGSALQRLLVGAGVALLGLACALALLIGGGRADAAKSASKKGTHPKPAAVPAFARDTSWPKALPNNWVFGGADSVASDRHGNIWVLSRPAGVPAAELAAGKMAAPPVVQLDAQGNFIRGWGGPQWIQPWFQTADPLPDYPVGTPAEHGITVDDHDNVWVTGAGHIVLKFSTNGTLLLQIGTFNQTGGSNNTTLLGNPTDVAVDTARREVYVADGYLNRRVIVFDSQTGAYKRHWGAYGNVPNDDPAELYRPGTPPPTQFFIVHGIQLSRDGLVYVSDRQRDRIQVFRRDGTFVREAFVDPEAPAGGGITETGVFTDPRVSGAGYGSVFRTAFSADKAQTYLYASVVRNKVFILRRKDMKEIGWFPATGLHHIASDRSGNLYTSDGRAPQKFVLTSRAGR